MANGSSGLLLEMFLLSVAAEEDVLLWCRGLAAHGEGGRRSRPERWVNRTRATLVGLTAVFRLGGDGGGGGGCARRRGGSKKRGAVCTQDGPFYAVRQTGSSKKPVVETEHPGGASSCKLSFLKGLLTCDPLPQASYEQALGGPRL